MSEIEPDGSEVKSKKSRNPQQEKNSPDQPIASCSSPDVFPSREFDHGISKENGSGTKQSEKKQMNTRSEGGNPLTQSTTRRKWSERPGTRANCYEEDQEEAGGEVHESDEAIEARNKKLIAKKKAKSQKGGPCACTGGKCIIF